MKSLRLLLVTLAAGVVLLIGGVVPAQAATIIVSGGGSLQAAIDAANPGDTILVETGAYYGPVVISKPRITLRGVSSPAIIGNGTTSVCGDVGVCVLGDVDLGSGTVFSYVGGVTVSGFVVRGFSDSDIAVFGGDGTTISHNQALQTGEYGIAAFMSKNTRVLANSARGAEEAGIYIGDSPNANATVMGNTAQGNALGIFVRNAQRGTIANNGALNNCAGIFFLADAPGPVGYFSVTGNTLTSNSAGCGDVSGVGVGLIGATGVLVRQNTITHNVPVSPHTFIKGGIVVMQAFGGTVATGNTITANTLSGNSPDIFWDKLGANVFTLNICHSSVPAGLCSH